MKKLLILDTSAIMYRAYFALYNLRSSTGAPVGALIGFIKQLDAAIEYFKPDYILAAKDVKRAELKRREIYSEYKENRSGMPDDLASQIDGIDRVLSGYGIPRVSLSGYEADDVIATLSKKYSPDYEVIVITGDKDLAQILDKNITIALMGKKEQTDPYMLVKTESDVVEFLGVNSNQIKDLFGLMGDSSDGIPGVAGIGPKTGIKLINEYSTLENIYENIDSIKGKVKEKLLENKEMAYISRNLATVFSDLELDVDIEDGEFKGKNFEILEKLYLEYDLKQEYSKLSENRSSNKVEFKINKLDNLSDFITKINAEKSKISFYYGDEGLSYFNGKEVYICLEKDDNADDLFKVSSKITDISNDLDVIVFSNKEILNLGLDFKKYFDILLANFTLGTDRAQKIETMAFEMLNISIEEYDKKTISKLSTEDLMTYYISRLSNISYSIYMLEEMLTNKLKELNMYEIYLEEKRFTKVLKYMEDNGISIDIKYFEKYNYELISKISEIEEEIYNLSGEKFNISSPKQLSNILFEKLGIEGGKKNKNGNYSTDAAVLELLKDRGILIAEKILEYREYEKLRSTYVEPLLKLQKLGKIHTTYNQTGTTTGRLSSQNPNLQNIPTRTTEGTKIRTGFIASPGYRLMSFDYSQIELRVLAEISGDKNLIDAYKHNLDLHELTARKIFVLNENEKVNKYQRNIAKVINFSVLYGKTPFGLSKELKITIGEAKEYIDTYFREYPKVRELLDEIIEKCRKNKYVETLYGTRRYVYDINSSNINVKEAANRMAVNTVIQGTAANIIKKVMYNIYEKLCNENVKMLLQVHDELIFEVKDENIAIHEEIQKIMEETIKFEKIKLQVNYNIGKTWGDLK